MREKSILYCEFDKRGILYIWIAFISCHLFWTVQNWQHPPREKMKGGRGECERTIRIFFCANVFTDFCMKCNSFPSSIKYMGGAVKNCEKSLQIKTQKWQKMWKRIKVCGIEEEREGEREMKLETNHTKEHSLIESKRKTEVKNREREKERTKENWQNKELELKLQELKKKQKKREKEEKKS